MERYSRIFPCVEINTSFYRPHQQKTYARWSQSVPDTFRFSVKMPRTITHELRLEHVDRHLDAFLTESGALGEKLGIILVQLPPSLALDVHVVRDFFDALRQRTHAAVACEPRHASWFTQQASALLGEANVSRVWADPPPVPDEDGAAVCRTGPLYIRLHGAPRIYYSAYEDAFLQSVANRMHEAARQGREAWCILDNTAHGQAIPNALTLQSHL